MGIIAPPCKGFDGKIFLKRISKMVESKKLSYSQRNKDSYHINCLLVDCKWHEFCFMPDMLPFHLFLCLQDTYNLEEDITEELVLSYTTYSTQQTNTKKIVRLDWDDKDLILNHQIHTVPGGSDWPIELTDFTLHVRVPRGKISEQYCSCDTKFMMDIIHEIGAAIRAKMPHVPYWIPIHLFMDNAGGHGTDVAKDEYENFLLEDYNVQIIWHCPNSPETNMLDLGAWMTIQHVAEEKHWHRMMNTNALAQTVVEAFADFDGSVELAVIADRWELVLDLIIDDAGNNNLIETKHGMLTKSLLGKRLPNSDLNNHVQSRHSEGYYEVYSDDEDGDEE